MQFPHVCCVELERLTDHKFKRNIEVYSYLCRVQRGVIVLEAVSKLFFQIVYSKIIFRVVFVGATPFSILLIVTSSLGILRANHRLSTTCHEFREVLLPAIYGNVHFLKVLISRGLLPHSWTWLVIWTSLLQTVHSRSTQRSSPCATPTTTLSLCQP